MTPGPKDPGPEGELAGAEAMFVERGRLLASVLDATVAGWVEAQVVRLAESARVPVDRPLRAEAARAGKTARRELAAAMVELLTIDVDAQTATPLELVRRCVRHPTVVLAAAGVPEVRRDQMKARAFPSDVYDLSPASWADVDPSLVEPGLAWGAAKAFLVLRRHREALG